MTDVAIEAVASPHAPEADLRDFSFVPRYRSAAEVLEEVRPEALIVAAATQAHADIAWQAIKANTPTLMEKPLARTEEEAEAIVKAAAEANVLLMPAHNDLFATGLDTVLNGTPYSRVTYTRLGSPSSPDSPRAWGRSSLFETLYHALVMTGQAMGGGVPTVTQAMSTGASRPERIRLTLAYAKGEADLLLDFAASTEELSLKLEPVDTTKPTMQWKRAGREVTILAGATPVPVRHEGGEHELMIGHFRDVVLGKSAAKTTAQDALDLMRAGRLCIEALEAAGAPFDRPNAPKHVASKIPERRAS